MHFVLAILALILSISRAVDNASLPVHPVNGLNIANTHTQGLPGGFNFSKESKGPLKNSIRIKAWDDATPVIVPAPFEFLATTRYYSKVSYLKYTCPVITCSGSSHSLRGPPKMV
jgi:hypothetical protein